MVATAKAVVCLSLWLSVCQVRSSHIPLEMNKTIQNLLQHYKIPNKDRFDGRPVFSTEPLTGRMEAKKVFMCGVLGAYEKLIGHMLKQLPTPSPQTAEAPVTITASNAKAGAVREELNYLLKNIQELKHRYQEQEKLLQGLQGLRHIQMNDMIVQSKALWELPWLFEEASSLINYNIKMLTRRQRRQARRLKTRPRA